MNGRLLSDWEQPCALSWSIGMKAGKLSESMLKRSVLKQLHTHHSTVVQGAGVGIDSAVLQLEAGEDAVCSVAPVTYGGYDSGSMAVCAALNNVVCQGAVPVAVMVSVLLPTSATEDGLRRIMRDMERVCEPAGVELAGGHTEVTRAIQTPLITAVGIGKVQSANLCMPQKITSDMDVVMTKWIGLQGTALVTKVRREALAERFSEPFLNQAEQFENYMSIWPEAAVAVKSGASGMHNVSEGGIYGALWEMAQASGVGLEIDLSKIAIRQETVEICEYLDINPYKLLGGGCLLIAAKDGATLCQSLEEEHIPAVLIGRTTDSNDRILYRGEERRYLETTQTDEIHKIL